MTRITRVHASPACIHHSHSHTHRQQCPARAAVGDERRGCQEACCPSLSLSHSKPSSACFPLCVCLRPPDRVSECKREREREAMFSFTCFLLRLSLSLSPSQQQHSLVPPLMLPARTQPLCVTQPSHFCLALCLSPSLLRSTRQCLLSATRLLSSRSLRQTGSLSLLHSLTLDQAGLHAR